MYQLGHYGIVLLLYAPVAHVLIAAGSSDAAVGGGVLVVVLAVAPDCDEYLPVPHRGPTHTIWFAAGVGLAIAVLGALLGHVFSMPLEWSILAGLLGFGAVLSHVIGDATTPMGIQPFAPVSQWHLTLDLVPSKDPIVNAGLFLIGSGAIGFVVLL